MTSIPHAHTFDEIKDPPRAVLHVATALAENFGDAGFNAEAKQEMLVAIAHRVAHDGLDGYKVHWSVPR